MVVVKMAQSGRIVVAIWVFLGGFPSSLAGIYWEKGTLLRYMSELWWGAHAVADVVESSD